MVFKTEEHKQDNITYHHQTTKRSEINQYSDLAIVGIQNVYSSIPRENYEQKFEKINIQRAFRQASQTNPFEVVIANSETAVCDNEMGKMLCQLVKQQSAPTVNIEEFDGNPLQYTYFRSMFREVMQKKIAYQQCR